MHCRRTQLLLQTAPAPHRSNPKPLLLHTAPAPHHYSPTHWTARSLGLGRQPQHGLHPSPGSFLCWHPDLQSPCLAKETSLKEIRCLQFGHLHGSARADSNKMPMRLHLEKLDDALAAHWHWPHSSRRLPMHEPCGLRTNEPFSCAVGCFASVLRGNRGVGTERSKPQRWPCWR
jgi:hypothetical protein